METRSYLGALAGGRSGSPSGATEQANATAKGQEQITKDLTARENEINQIISGADARASDDFEKQRQEFLANQKDAAAAEKELSGNLKTTAGDEIKTLAAHGLTYDDFVSKYGQARANQYMKDLGTDENGLRITFIKSTPEASKVFEKQVGNNYVIGYKDPVTGKISTQTVPLPAAEGDWSLQKIGEEYWWVDKKNRKTLPLSEAPGSPTIPTKTTPKTAAQLNEESDATNWLLRQPGYTPADKEAFSKDETFRAWAINQAKLEKAKNKSSPSILPPKS